MYIKPEEKTTGYYINTQPLVLKDGGQFTEGSLLYIYKYGTDRWCISGDGETFQMTEFIDNPLQYLIKTEETKELEERLAEYEYQKNHAKEECIKELPKSKKWLYISAWPRLIQTIGICMVGLSVISMWILWICVIFSVISVITSGKFILIPFTILAISAILVVIDGDLDGKVEKKVKNIDKERVWAFNCLQFTALSGRHSVLERPLSGENGRPFLVITPEIIGY